MSLSILDVCIGLSFAYLLLALICTMVNEWLAGLFGWRGKMLVRGVRSLLGEMADEVLSHPLIRSLGRKGAPPSYIPSSLFARVVMNVLAKGQETPTVEQVRLGLDRLANQEAGRALRPLVYAAGSDLAAAERAIAGWFDSGMDRVSGWYRRKMQAVTLLAALVVTLVTNADTLEMARKLWVNPALRAAVVEQAKARANQPIVLEYSEAEPESTQPVSGSASAQTGLSPEQEKVLGQLLGWSAEWEKFRSGAEQDVAAFLRILVVPHLLGWLLTAAAVSVGAPFWFDVLNKFIQVRGSVKPAAAKTT